MTREEAIARVKHQRDWANEVNRMFDVEALDMAIKALEQEPTTKNDLGVDYRSLEDIKKLVERKADDLDGVMLDAGGVIIGLYFAIANDLPSATPQEPMVEIDLYSVIKQSYIEREVLDKIRTEIEEQVLESLSDGGDDWFTAEKVNECLDIIDKYKAESEG